MRDANMATEYPEAQILDMMPQEYRIANRQVTDPVGMQGESIEANFLNVVARTSLKENIEKCVHDAGYELAELLISPLCLADTLLTVNEKQSGCALVDMGAETTTVSVYDRDILRHLAVIPLGGVEVTADIASQSIETEEAEALKVKYGTTYRSKTGQQGSSSISLNHNRSIDELSLQEIIEARYEEIIRNIWKQIEGRSERLLSGIVFTGGASRVKDLTEGFGKHARTDKLTRVMKGLPEGFKLAHGVTIDEPDRLYTLMALLQRGDQPCVGEPPSGEQELPFDKEEIKIEQEPSPSTPEPEQEPEPKKPKESLGKKFGRLWDKMNMIFEDTDV